jgi:Ser/Thr protein kinase RdoA (MazF antagonist)
MLSQTGVRARLVCGQERLWDWGFCHGDLHDGNAHVDGERLTLFDFDCCGPGWRVFDLATYRWAARLRQVEEQAWKPFVEAYLQVRPAAASTIELVPLFVILRHIWLQGYHVWNSVEAGANFQSDGFFEHLVGFCEQIESEDINQ